MPISKYPDQQVLGEDGDCLAASVAGILGLPLSDVPNFAICGYWDGLQKWFDVRGLVGISIRFPDAVNTDTFYFGYQSGLCLMWGMSPRFRDGKRLGHAVIGKPWEWGLKLVHDPHPSREGLYGYPLGVMWIVPKSSIVDPQSDPYEVDS